MKSILKIENINKLKVGVLVDKQNWQNFSHTYQGR